MHILIWLCGAVPSEAVMKQRLAESDVFAQTLLDYQAWIKSTELPIEQDIRCTNPNCDGGYDDLEEVSLAREDQPTGVTELPTSILKCSLCSQHVDAHDAIVQAARRILMLPDDVDHPAYLLFASDSDSFLASNYVTVQDDEHKTRAIQTLRLLLCQCHLPTHTHTCFKGRRRCPCRFHYPQATTAASTITVKLDGVTVDMVTKRVVPVSLAGLTAENTSTPGPMDTDDDGPVQGEQVTLERLQEMLAEAEIRLGQARPKASRWLVGFNNVLTQLFRCNHDIKLLLTATTDLIYYVLGKLLSSGLGVYPLELTSSCFA